MDFYKDVIQPGVGFCLFCCVVGGAIKACLDSNKPTYSSTQSSTYDYPSSSSSEEEPETSSGGSYSSSSYSEESVYDDFPSVEIEEPSGHFEYVRKQVPCHVCDGQGFIPSNLTASGKVRCGFCSGKGYETITEQEWVE